MENGKLRESEPVTVLGIESSCDECAAAVVRNGRTVLSSVVSSQVELHARYGGVVPEIAARRHVETIIPVLTEAMSTSGLAWPDLDAIAVTRGPGLMGSLLVGVSAAKSLAAVFGLPLVAVNHLEGHICACYLGDPPPVLPAVCLIVSGGHTDLILVEDWGQYQWLGGTLDDAAGETLDKVARRAGLGYPGGPVIDRLSRSGSPTAVQFPRSWLHGKPDFSFSGLKTAALRAIQSSPDLSPEDLSASLQAAIVDVLVRKTMESAAHHGVRGVMLTGGVAANSALRETMASAAAAAGVGFSTPPRKYCTDNAVMIAAAGWFRFCRGEADSLEFDTEASLELCTAGG
jgi:N6-L-threonylcarbamoyladenine synthase